MPAAPCSSGAADDDEKYSSCTSFCDSPAAARPLQILLLLLASLQSSRSNTEIAAADH